MFSSLQSVFLALYAASTFIIPVLAEPIKRYKVWNDVQNIHELYDPKRASDTEEYLAPNTLYLGLTKPRPGENDYQRVIFATDHAGSGGTLFRAIYDDREPQKGGPQNPEWVQIHKTFTDNQEIQSLLIGQIVLMIAIGVRPSTDKYSTWKLNIIASLYKCYKHMNDCNRNPDSNTPLSEAGGYPFRGYNSIVWVIDALSFMSKVSLIGPFEGYDFSKREHVDTFQQQAKLEASGGVKDGARMIYVNHGYLRIRSYLTLQSPFR